MRRLMVLIEAHAPPLFPQLYDGAQGEVVPDHSAIADTILGVPTALLRAAEAMPDSGVNDQKQKQGHRRCCRRPCLLPLTVVMVSGCHSSSRYPRRCR